uniref:Uncharacterized protein n=1 Tax=Meloidogyne javanica TaxID=6303 RepID=A0A915NE50_MELJA
MAICCGKSKKNKKTTTSLKSEIRQPESAMISGKEAAGSETAIPPSTREKISGNKSVISTNTPAEKTTQKAPTATGAPQEATKTSKKGKGLGKIAEVGGKKSSVPSPTPPTTPPPVAGSDVISLIPMSPSTPTSVPTISSKESGTSGTSKLITETATTATSDPAPSSNIIEDIDDSVSSASKKSAKRKRSAAIRAHEDGPEDEMTDPGSYHTLADLSADKVFQQRE